MNLNLNLKIKNKINGSSPGCNIQKDQISRESYQPRSYDVVIARSNFRRNRRDIIPVPSNSSLHF